MFAGWKRVAYEITPATGWGVISHLEASNLGRPGDGPVLWALGKSGLPAGTVAAQGVYDRAHQTSAQMGNAYDASQTVSSVAMPRRSDYGGDDDAYFQAMRDYLTTSPIQTKGADYSPDTMSMVKSGQMQAPTAPEDEHSFFSVIKGASRWALLALDVVPEGFDAVARAATAVKSGDLTLGQAVGGMFGGEYSEVTGIPLFSYLAAAGRGERLNMGQGWFAQGEVAENIKVELDRWDTVTWGPMDAEGNRSGGLTQQDFERARAAAKARGENGVIVTGLNGKNYVAESLDEWKYLRDTAGRGALLEWLVPRSAEQQALGVAHGAFQEQIFDEATVVRQPKTGRYFTQGSGTSITAGVGNAAFRGDFLAPDTHAFNIMSGTIDFGKQLMDFPILKTAKGTAHLVSSGGRFVGLSDEAGRLASSTAIANDVLKGADVDAVDAVKNDLFSGRVNREAAANALARQQDTALTAANKTVGALRTHGAKASRTERANQILEMVKSGVDRTKATNMAKAEMTEAQLTNLIRRAAGGDTAARSWAEKILTGTDPNLPDVGVALDNLIEVTARGGVDLPKGVFGRAVVDDEIWAAAYQGVDTLDGVIRGGGGWAIPDPTEANPNRLTMTFDADLGRAQRTLDDLRKSSPDGQHQGIVSRLIGEHWATRRWAEKRLARQYAEVTDEVTHAPTSWVKTLENPGQREREILAGGRNSEARLWAEQYPHKSDRVGFGTFRKDIKEKGILEPLEIGIEPSGRAILLDGHHRLQAALDLGLDEVPVHFHVGLHGWPAARGGQDVSEFLNARKVEDIRGTKTYTQERADQVFDVLPWKGVDDVAGDKATAEVDNLIRVLKRMDGDKLFTEGASSVRPSLNPEKLTTLLTGGGKADDLIDSLTAATTHREVKAILQPTMEFSGRIPPALIDALARASTKGETTQMMLDLAAGTPIMPQRMALLGMAGRVASNSHLAGMGVGALAAMDEPLEEGDFGGAVAAGITGALFGGLVGSGLGSVGGYMFGKSTRKIEDVADAMDLLLAGTRSTTLRALDARGIDTNRALAGLSVPSLLSYGYGNSALGRRLMRSAATNMNLTDPTDVYYKLADYAQSLGLTIDDEVRFMVRKVGEGDELVEKVVRSSFATADEFEARLAKLADEGYDESEVVRMDDVFSDASQLLPNNPARAYQVLRSFGRVVDAALADRGLPEEFRELVTKFTQNSGTEFLGALDASGRAAAHMQYVVNREVRDGSVGARLESELWSGHIELPPPEKVQRAINQLDKLGRTTQLFTGQGVSRQLVKNLSEVAGGRDWVRITPELERNIAIRSARAVSQGLWAPVVLLGRPFAFLSRVLGEDQARMAASSLPNMFTHPLSYFSYVAGNYGFFKNKGMVRGVASRSIIPDEVISGGKVDTDVLDNMTHWDLAEEARHALNIYDRRLSQERQRMFGHRVWSTAQRGDQTYLDYLTGEIRQLVADPMVRHMARSTADDPVADTIRWLNETSQGRKVKEDWARQFKSEAQAAEFMRPDNLGAFLHDQYARLHLKTGGDWVFKWDDSYTTSTGRGLSPEEAKRRGYDKMANGYIVFRKGDDEMLKMVGTGKMENVRLVDEDGVEYIEEALLIRDSLTDAKWDAMKRKIRDKRDTWERAVDGPNYDPVNSHRFPATVKGSASDNLTLREKAQVWDYWETALDRMYDWILGRPSRVLSRQPVFGAHYWERIGMLYPSMTDEMQAAYRAIAEQEGVWRHVRKVAQATDSAGAGAKGTLDDVSTIDLNAKAYSIERTRDILFDLHRQRNFIDGMRIIMPFAGPFVEALEAWSRVIRQDPLTVWRRGSQIVEHTWNTTGIGDDPDPFGQGWFWTDPETGDEMFSYPFLGEAIPEWLNAGGPDGSGRTPLGGRARGLNIVFGTEDLTQGEGPEVLGFPVAAANAGIGPVLQGAVAPFLKDREGALGQVYNEMFPFGVPDNPWELLPYNLRKLAEGHLGRGSQLEMVRHSVQQFGLMNANGEIGEGAQYAFDVTKPGGIDRAWAEAEKRAAAANKFEALARTVTPTLTTPEALIQIKAVPGLDSERFITIGALADKARELMSEEGAQWYYTPDGYRLSTEGDWEITTEWMNQEYGLDMFSAEFLSLPLTDRPYPLVYTTEGASWVRSRETLVSDLKASGPLVMPNYANLKESEGLESQRGEPDDIGYSHEAFEQAVEMGLATWFTPDEHQIEIQSRLLKAANRRVERDAIEIYGVDDELSPEGKDAKARYIRDEKERNAARYQGGDISDSQKQLVIDELNSWNKIDWSGYALSPEEAATVQAVNWYLGVVDSANVAALDLGLVDVTLKGAGDDEKAAGEALRRQLVEIVDTQIHHAAERNVDMGNFVYIWETFLRDQYVPSDEDYDQLEDLASIQSLDLEEYLPRVGGP